MPFAKLKSDILATREQRQHCLDKRIAAASGQTLLMLSLNIPGSRKCSEKLEQLFAWGEGQLGIVIANLRVLERQKDILGPWALYATNLNPLTAKEMGCMIEEQLPAARLLDIDIYDPSGAPCRRELVHRPPRTCFICPAPATECIRLGRHSPCELQQCLDELLSHIPS